MVSQCIREVGLKTCRLKKWNGFHIIVVVLEEVD
jgi:hypothetical protein